MSRADTFDTPNNSAFICRIIRPTSGWDRVRQVPFPAWPMTFGRIICVAVPLLAVACSHGERPRSPATPLRERSALLNQGRTVQVTTPSDNEIVLVQTLVAPREAVFAAFTNAEQLATWHLPFKRCNCDATSAHSPCIAVANTDKWVPLRRLWRSVINSPDSKLGAFSNIFLNQWRLPYNAARLYLPSVSSIDRRAGLVFSVFSSEPSRFWLLALSVKSGKTPIDRFLFPTSIRRHLNVDSVKPRMILPRHLAELRRRKVDAIPGARKSCPRVWNSAGTVRLFRYRDLEQKRTVKGRDAVNQARLSRLCSCPPVSTTSPFGLTIGPGTDPPARRLGTTQRTC